MPTWGNSRLRRRGRPSPAFAMEGIRIRVKRNDTDEEDFDRFFGLIHSKRSPFEGMVERSVIEHFAKTRFANFVERLAAKIDQLRDRNPYDLMPLIGSLILCDPHQPLVAPGMSDLLEHNWNIRHIFAERGFPADKIAWKARTRRKSSALGCWRMRARSRFRVLLDSEDPSRALAEDSNREEPRKRKPFIPILVSESTRRGMGP